MSFISMVANIVNNLYPDILKKHEDVLSANDGFNEKYNDFTNETDGKYEDFVAKFNKAQDYFSDLSIKYNDFTNVEDGKYEDFKEKYNDVAAKFETLTNQYEDITNENGGKYEDFISKYNQFNEDKITIDEKLSLFDIEYIQNLNATMEELKTFIENQSVGIIDDFNASFEVENA